MRNFLLGVVIFLLIGAGCQSYTPEIEVLGEQIPQENQGPTPEWHSYITRGYVVNGGAGSTEIFYTDDEGKKRMAISNVVRVPVREECEEVERPLPPLVELPPLPDPVEEPPLAIDVATNTTPNVLLAASKKLPDVHYRTTVVIPRKPPRLKITKSSDEKELCCDRQLTFRIKFENIGGSNANNVILFDNVPAHVEYQEGSAGADPYLTNIDLEHDKNDRVQKIVWNIEGPIAPGEEGEAFYTVVCLPTTPNLSCRVDFEPKMLEVGQKGNVICTVMNSGSGPAKGARLLVTLPAGLEYNGNSSGTTVGFNLGVIPPQQSVVERLQITMRSGGRLDNITAKVNADNGEGCDCSVPVTPELEIHKTGPAQIYNRLPMEYMIVVKNVSARASQATNVVLTDQLPAKAKFKSATDNGSYDEATHIVTWYLGTMQPGDIVTRKVVAIPHARGSFVDKAQVTCNEGITVTDTAETIVKGITALHVTDYDTEDPVEVGETTTYVIEVRNEGFKNATSVRLEDQIPRLAEFVSASAKDGKGNEISFEVVGKKVVFAAIPALESGEKATYRVTVRLLEKGELLNIATVGYTEFSKTITVQEPTSSY